MERNPLNTQQDPQFLAQLPENVESNITAYIFNYQRITSN